MHRYPKRIVRTGEHLDVDRMNSDIMPVSENTFALDGDAFADNCITEEFIGRDAHAQVGYDESAVDTTIADFAFPSVPVPSATTIPNNGDWVALAAEVSIACGAAILVVEGNCQYIRHTFGGTTPYHDPDDGATASGVVIGISCRGEVYPLSSLEDPLLKPPAPIRALTQRGLDSGGAASTTRLPGPVGPYQKPAGAHGPELAPVHQIAVFTVSPGTHQIQLVGKRVAVAREWDSTDYVQVTQEQIFVDVLPLMPPATAALDGESVELFESEDSLSTQNMAALRFTLLRAALNGVTPGMVKRGAFTSRLLYPPALFASSAHQVGTVATSYGPITSVYPGYASTISGWTILSDGAGDEVESSSIVMGTTPVRVKITARIHIRNVESASAIATAHGLANIACACIAETVSGTTTPIGVSERYVNSFGNVSGVGKLHEEFIVTLIAYRSFVDGTGGTRQWHVYGSAACFTIAGDARWYFRSARIDVEVKHAFGG